MPKETSYLEAKIENKQQNGNCYVETEMKRLIT